LIDTFFAAAAAVTDMSVCVLHRPKAKRVAARAEEEEEEVGLFFGGERAGQKGAACAVFGRWEQEREKKTRGVAAY
jgi:hypothetical protein